MGGGGGKALAQQVSLQRPDFCLRVLACYRAPKRRVEVFRAGTGAFAGDGEAIAKDKDAERQQPKWAEVTVVRTWPLDPGICPSGNRAGTSLGGSEVVLADDYVLDSLRRISSSMSLVVQVT